MFAKTLIPGPHPVPALVAAVGGRDGLLGRLRDRGWAAFGATSPPATGDAVLVRGGHLQLVVDGEIVLDDLNPAAPTLWWSAVSDLQERCVAVVAAEEDLDLTGHEARDQLVGLLGSGRALAATVPVVASRLDQVARKL